MQFVSFVLSIAFNSCPSVAIGAKAKSRHRKKDKVVVNDNLQFMQIPVGCEQIAKNLTYNHRR